VGNGTTGNLTGKSDVSVTNGTLAIDLATGQTLSAAVTLNGTSTTLNAMATTGTNTLSGNITGTGSVNQNGTSTNTYGLAGLAGALSSPVPGNSPRSAIREPPAATLAPAPG
jgi:hypothetical protein